MNPDDLLRLAYVGMHPDRRQQLVAKHGGVAGALRAVRNGRVKVPDRARNAAAVDPDQRRTELAALGIGVVVRGDPCYPEHLADLPDSPDLLFVKGCLAPDPGVAVVGSRKATSYGLALARAYGAALAAAGWPVISGLARGIDGAAHRGALDTDGRGIAVMGCGLDAWYPSEHRRLGEALVQAAGCIVSEYPPGAPPTGWRFPPRNRIISGLAAAVVIVEAAKKGGALITARCALAQGRDVFAVPGDINRQTSEGCNLLIRDGAIPVLGPEDLVEAISLILGPPDYQAAAPEPVDELVGSLGGVGRTVDWLANHLDRPITEVLARISRLEAQGVVTRSGALIAPVSTSGHRAVPERPA